MLWLPIYTTGFLVVVSMCTTLDLLFLKYIHGLGIFTLCYFQDKIFQVSENILQLLLFKFDKSGKYEMVQI